MTINYYYQKISSIQKAITQRNNHEPLKRNNRYKILNQKVIVNQNRNRSQDHQTSNLRQTFPKHPLYQRLLRLKESCLFLLKKHRNLLLL